MSKEVKHETRQSFEELFNLMLPSLQKLEQKRGKFSDFESFDNFKQKVKNRLIYKLLPIFNLTCWNNIEYFTQKGFLNGDKFDGYDIKDIFLGEYHEIPFEVCETSNSLSITFKLNKKFKGAVSVSVKSYSPSIILKLPFLIIICLFCIFATLIFLLISGYNLIEGGFLHWFILLLCSLICSIVVLNVGLPFIRLKKKIDNHTLKLESVDFVKRYDVFGDQVYGRAILTTAFMDRLMSMQNAFSCSFSSCLIKDEYIKFEFFRQRDFFEFVNLDIPLDSPECFQVFYNQMVSIWDMIEHLKFDKNI